MRSLYTIGIVAYSMLAKIVSLFNTKAKAWVNGRKNSEIYKLAAGETSREWIWFHAASLGEFEQGRPLIEAIKSLFPEKKILLTFFSPSGYEVRKNYDLADRVEYLPHDTISNAKRLISTYGFEMVFFIKYEFWFNYMYLLYINKIPLYFISARFRQDQHFFSWYGWWFRKQLGYVSTFFIQDENSAKLLRSISLSNYVVTGDTRFDRVFRLSRQQNPLPQVEKFVADRKVFVVGSSWPADEELLIPVIAQLPDDYAVILAPHDVSEKHIKAIESQLQVSYTRYSAPSNEKTKVLVIDNVGLLSQLYRFAQFAYVGGGFGQNIHNIQEAVAYGCPVFFGPNHKNFTEALDLVRLGGAFAVGAKTDLLKIVNKFIQDDVFRQSASDVCRRYVEESIGATDKVMKSVFEI